MTAMAIPMNGEDSGDTREITTGKWGGLETHLEPLVCAFCYLFITIMSI